MSLIMLVAVVATGLLEVVELRRRLRVIEQERRDLAATGRPRHLRLIRDH